MSPLELQNQIAGAVNFFVQNGGAPSNAICALETIKFTLLLNLAKQGEQAKKNGIMPAVILPPNGRG